MTPAYSIPPDVQDIMRERGISARRAYDVLKRRTAEANRETIEPSIREKILVALSSGTAKDAQELHRAVSAISSDKVSFDKLVRQTWSLIHQAEVKSRKHGDNNLTNIRLTPKGRMEATALMKRKAVDDVNGRRGRVIHAPAANGESLVCVTDGERWPCTVAVERGITATPSPEVIPEVPYEPHSVLPEPPRQNEKPVIDEAAAGEVASPSASVASPSASDAIDLAAYPLISDLMGKTDRIAAYERAARELEGFDEELALMLLEKIQLTDLEKEVISLVQGLR